MRGRKRADLVGESEVRGQKLVGGPVGVRTWRGAELEGKDGGVGGRR